MEMRNLYNALREQYEFLQAYLSALFEHQQAIINSDIVELEETIKSESALLIVIENYQNKIFNSIKELSERYSLGLKTFRLSDFIYTVKEQDKGDVVNLIKMRDSLTKMSADIARVNNQNKILIEQSRYLIKGTIAAIINSNKNPILDRTI